ncbi:hypothetical protein GB928_004105 [Shinella curvata]|uniref:Uncharacterized protein n=1 Tax=Shinella curvata TaxID=1817964 RepID=A0ABT8X9E4_9HYPH|nr:hypothetical protein [Shinella curvata]MCJ8051695.1 hypothetical protein [Shinella curvata]MDO6120358.1 hypothetical protein [Shinella curvata]
MNWREIYPEGSTVFIGRDRYIATHNEHGLGLDLYCLKTGDRAMTITPEFVSQIVDGIRYR